MTICAFAQHPSIVRNLLPMADFFFRAPVDQLVCVVHLERQEGESMRTHRPALNTIDNEICRVRTLIRANPFWA